MSAGPADEARPALRLVCIATVTLVLAAHELVVRQTRVFLTPLSERGEALALAAFGALVAGILTARVKRPREGLAWSFLGLSFACPLSIGAFTLAFATPALWVPVRLVLPTLDAALCVACAVCLVRSLGTAWSTLGLVRGLLGPGRVLLTLVGSILGASLGARLGLLRYGLVLGVLSAFVAFRADSMAGYLWGRLPKRAHLRTSLALGSAALSALLLHQAGRFVPEEALDQHEATVVYASGVGRERVEVTSAQGAFALFVGGSLRWSGLDGMRYADALVAPAVGLTGAPKRCLVLGGGEGLIVRRLLSAPSVTRVTLVTPESALVRESERLVPLRPWTVELSSDRRLELIASEPLPWLDTLPAAREPYEVILVDLPDPTDTVAAKNYTRYFYERVRGALAPGGAVAVQAAPLLRAPGVFLNVAATLEQAGFVIRPYEAELPSLGLWGFLLGIRPDDTRAELVGASRRAPWPSLAEAAPVRPLAADTPFDGLDEEAPSRLDELRVLLLQSEARRTHDDAPGTSL